MPQSSFNLRRLIGWLLGLFASSSAQPAARAGTTAASSLERDGLQQLALRYEKELCGRTFSYTFSEKGRKPQEVILEFEPGNFCHLFSIGSMAKGAGLDPAEFSGWKGWNNIRSGKITYAHLQKLNSKDFAFYAKEQQMFDELLAVLQNPQAVRYLPEKVPGSRLSADILLYGLFGEDVIHLGISKDRDGSWFARSYFVRETGKEKEYPTRYLHGMPELKVIDKVSSKKA